MTVFSGIWVPLVTPFRDGAVDFPALQPLARHIAGAGVAGLVVCGSTGEAAALSETEQLAVLDTVLQAVPDCPIVMGLAGNNLKQVLDRLRQIQCRAIRGLLVPPPYYIRPAQAGLIEYYRILADAAAVPLIVYNIPYRTGINIEPETMREIAQHERVTALKDCGGNQAATMQLIADDVLDVLAGEDLQTLSTLCLGGCGAILASAHIRPDLFVRLARHVENGDLHAAQQVFYRLLPMIRLLFEEPNPAPIKAALAMMGFMRDELRAPMANASPALKEKLAYELKRLECL